MEETNTLTHKPKIMNVKSCCYVNKFIEILIFIFLTEMQQIYLKNQPFKINQLLILTMESYYF